MTSRRDEIIAVARELLDEQGSEGLTMRAIATELGIQAPSLYKHIADKHELEVALIIDGLTEQADAFATAVAGAADPVGAIAATYRSWALAHPHRYRLMTDRPLPRSELPEGLEARAAAPLLAAVDGDPNRARATWAFAHGMVTLELADRFPPDADLDAAWTTGLNGIANTHQTEKGMDT
jgi:AcrR family transcriptional regulator